MQRPQWLMLFPHVANRSIPPRTPSGQRRGTAIRRPFRTLVLVTTMVLGVAQAVALLSSPPRPADIADLRSAPPTPIVALRG